MLKWSMGKDKSKILKISVEAAALDLLRALQGEVSVISVVGPYRSGKSFLLNQILHDIIDNSPGLHAADQPQNPHFKIGDTIMPETEEVSMLVIPACARPQVFLVDAPHARARVDSVTGPSVSVSLLAPDRQTGTRTSLAAALL